MEPACRGLNPHQHLPLTGKSELCWGAFPRASAAGCAGGGGGGLGPRSRGSSPFSARRHVRGGGHVLATYGIRWASRCSAGLRHSWSWTRLDGSHPESTAGSGRLVPVRRRVKSYGADKLPRHARDDLPGYLCVRERGGGRWGLSPAVACCCPGVSLPLALGRAGTAASPLPSALGALGAERNVFTAALGKKKGELGPPVSC